jgi:potassium efflux system protein
MLIGIGWIGSESQAPNDFLASLGHGFLVMAGFLAPVLLLREICRVDGLGEGHFGWPTGMCDRMRKACDTAIVCASPIVLTAATLRTQADESIANSLGRYCILVFLGLMIFILHRLLLPSRFWSSYANYSQTWYRVRRLVYFIAIAIPITLVILVCSGYLYISHAIAARLLYTSAILLVVLLVESIALRATMLRRRKLSIQQLRQQRQQLADKATEGDSELVVGADTAVDVNLNSVSQQARQLIRLIAIATATTLVWMIWSDLLPALGMLDRATIWVVGEGADLSDVTLRDLLFAVFATGLTVFAVKNLPAVIELLLLQKLPINPGARYAITTIFRYILGTVGVLIGLSFLSIPWSQLSWIVAAASVGLGFGLQEIVANFVSGIILLLEQPIRVGDVVTVDGTTGVVTKMQIRATTVTNWDRQELVVPNKDLITGKLLNWSLSNVINRVALDVGVAYGTDIETAHRLIMAAAASHPEVMSEPPPIVTLEKFGDSSLNFVVRCYLPSLDKRLQTIHELHAAIAKSLDKAGIVIPFPQRDVHLTLTTDSRDMAQIRAAIRSADPPEGGAN